MKERYRGEAASYETYHPNPRQELFHRVKRWPGFNKLIKGAIGGVGGGKSIGCMQEQAEIAMRCPGATSLAARVSMPKADTTLVDEYAEFLGPAATWVETKASYYLPNGHQLLVLPADKMDRFGSTKFVTVYLQETQEMESRVFDVMSDRLRHPGGMVDGVPWYRILFDARPIESKHWLNENFIEKAWKIDSGEAARARAKNGHWVYVPFSSYDNQKNLRPGYIEELIAEHRDEPAWIRMMIYGEVGYSLTGRPVYGDSYNPEIHDANIEEDPRLPILRGWDFGYRSPAVLWCQWSRDGRLLVLRDFCPKRIARDRLVDEVLAIQAAEFPLRHASQYRDFGDIAGAQIDASGITNIEYVEGRLETSFEGLQKAQVEDGINVVRQLMRKPVPYHGKVLTCFLVDERCETLREALRGMYQYPEKGEHREPVKGNGYDDVADALRYVAQSLVSEQEPGGAAGYGSDWEDSEAVGYAHYGEAG